MRKRRYANYIRNGRLRCEKYTFLRWKLPVFRFSFYPLIVYVCIYMLTYLSIHLLLLAYDAVRYIRETPYPPSTIC